MSRFLLAASLLASIIPAGGCCVLGEAILEGTLDGLLGGDSDDCDSSGNSRRDFEYDHLESHEEMVREEFGSVSP